MHEIGNDMLIHMLTYTLIRAFDFPDRVQILNDVD
jgi:hypothetical protein